MPDITGILDEVRNIAQKGTSIDQIRRKYIKELAQKRGRNVIIYYSGWFQKPDIPECSILDTDINGFMSTIHNLDKSIGLDLILHTPGGSLAATENIVNYLRSVFNCDIVAFIPQIAMSAGTMIACSCKEIYMGKQSSLGPIDPQFSFPGMGQVAARGIIEEVKRGVEEVKKDSHSQVFWANIFSKYPPTFVGTCEKAIQWSEEITTDWLQDCMFKEDENAEILAKSVVSTLSSHEKTKSHSRHLSNNRCKEIGLKIMDLESDNELQDLVLSVHHSCMLTLENQNIVKIIENQNEKAFITRLG